MSPLFGLVLRTSETVLRRIKRCRRQCYGDQSLDRYHWHDVTSATNNFRACAVSPWCIDFRFTNRRAWMLRLVISLNWRLFASTRVVRSQMKWIWLIEKRKVLVVWCKGLVYSCHANEVIWAFNVTRAKIIWQKATSLFYRINVKKTYQFKTHCKDDAMISLH